MECTSIKFELFWRKISRKDGCKGVSENARDEEWRLAYMTYQANQRDAELRGEARGDERRAKESALSMYSDGLTVEKIAKYVGYAVDVVKKWVGVSV